MKGTLEARALAFAPSPRVALQCTRVLGHPFPWQPYGAHRTALTCNIPPPYTHARTYANTHVHMNPHMCPCVAEGSMRLSRRHRCTRAGRMLEVRSWMVKLNRGVDFVSMDDILVDLKLTADVSGSSAPCPRRC